MSRRSGVSDDTAGECSPRERSDSVSSSTESCEAAPAPQFVPIHSRVVKRYQATIPELLVSPVDATELLYNTQSLQLPRLRYCSDRAQGGRFQPLLQLLYEMNFDQTII